MKSTLIDTRYILIDGMHFPIDHVIIIKQNWINGLPLDKCSPRYKLTRNQIARIICSSNKDLKS